jgi:hypothetical protein
LSIAPAFYTESYRRGKHLAYRRAEVIAMPQKSNDPFNAERSTVPQEQDDELEMAEDDEDVDDEDFDSESELEDDVEE